MNSKSYFIASFTTDIGKTHFVTKFIKSAIEQKIPINAIKPIITGFDENDNSSDSAKIIKALGFDLNQSNLDKISPWRFDQPCSPHLLGDIINYQDLKTFCTKKITESTAQNKLLLIESAGGIMTPISYSHNFLNLAQDLNSPVIFITQNFLGSISQTLTAIEALKNKGCDIKYIIVNNKESQQDSMMSDDQFASDIKKFTKVATYKITDFIANLKDFA